MFETVIKPGRRWLSELRNDETQRINSRIKNSKGQISC